MKYYFMVIILLCHISSKGQESFIFSDGIENYYLLPGVKKISNNCIEVWLKIEPNKEKLSFYRQKRIEARESIGLPTQGWEHYTYQKVKRLYDCKNRKLKILKLVTCFENDKTTNSDGEYNTEWISIVPGTPSEKVFDHICK